MIATKEQINSSPRFLRLTYAQKAVSLSLSISLIKEARDKNRLQIDIFIRFLEISAKNKQTHKIEATLETDAR